MKSYREKEANLTNEFKNQTTVFMETIQQEMTSILESKGLTSEKRQELEKEYLMEFH